MADWLADDSESQETVMAAHEELDNRRKALSSALGVLNDRERRIFEARRLADDPVTLEELAEEFGVSRERVRQIEVRAFEKGRSGEEQGDGDGNAVGPGRGSRRPLKP